MIKEKYPGYCNQCSKDVIGTCETCSKEIGRPPKNMWYKLSEKQARISHLMKELAHQAASPPKMGLELKDREAWQEYAQRCRMIEEELQDLGVEL